MLSKIFAKNLSEHSINVYRLINEEVGKSFAAVQPIESLSSTTINTLTSV
jgi:hypothetical protein